MSSFNKAFTGEKTDKILTHCRIIDPATGFDEVGEIVIKDGKILDFGKGVGKKYIDIIAKKIDCEGHVVCPGLIDMQVHFRDPGQTFKEDIVSGSKSAVAGGVTSVVCQPNTKPVLDNVASLDYIKHKTKAEGYCNIYVYAAITKNMEGKEITEMQSLADTGIVVGFTDDGLPVMDAYIMRRAFEYVKPLNLVIAQHAEDLNLSNKGAINEGEVSEKLGVRGVPNISESVIVGRDVELANLTGGKYHVLHVSARESLEHIRIAKKKGLKVTAEVSPHHFSLTDKQVLKSGTDAKMNPPLRSEEDRKALIEALKDGTLDAIATDHAPHDKASKETSLQDAAFGIVGLETFLPISLELYHNKTLSLHELLKKITCNPADILGIDKGRIKKGADADLTVIDLNKAWTINREDFSSKSKNTPFDGRKTKGKAIKTFVAGQLVYS